MENREVSPCQGFVDYMSGEMSEVDGKRFERHLESCAACREDAAEWRSVWDRLSEDAEPAVLPVDLKQEVLAAAYAVEPELTENRTPGMVRRWVKPFQAFAVAAALAIAFVAGFGWRGFAPATGDPAKQAAETPSQIEKLIRLERTADKEAYTNAKSAYGVVCLLRANGERRLVVYTFGIRRSEGKEVYHVWLLHNDGRRSAGTFTVDASGVGLLTIPWPEDSPSFDKVGVTLEPDSHSQLPRGQKVFQSV